MQDELQTLYTSGTVFHAFLGEKLPSWKSAATLIRTIAENYKLPYYTLSPTYSVCKNHGYIAGEVYTCPHCGEKTEVYSRITGYYRPVQNWNDGKTQEYKDRVVYTPEKFGNKKPILGEMPYAADGCECASAEPEKLLLFTTKTCPKCRMAKMFLDQAGIQYETVVADDNPDLAREYGIKEAPTLVVITAEGATKIANPSNIKAFCDANVRA
jgi:ribonucleoside-triphosphate reductase